MIQTYDDLGVQFTPDDTRDETKRQVLWAMRRTLLELGWCKASWAQADVGPGLITSGPIRVFDVEPTGGSACRVCLGGALAFVLDDKHATAPKHGMDWETRPSKLALAIREDLGGSIYARSGMLSMYSPATLTDALDIMVDWNDKEQRTIADVVDLLDYAIAHIPEPEL